MKFGPLEDVVCALCGEGKFEPVISEEWFGNTFHIVRCPRCKLIFTNPRPSSEWKKRFYDPEFNVYLQQDGINFCYQRKEENSVDKAPVWAFLEANGTMGSRLLDGGCSAGLFAKTARDHGFAVTGFDVSHRALAYAHEHYRIDVLASDVENIAIADNSYDVITLIQVFEHFKDPVRALSELNRVLKPGGILYIETVNYLKLYWLERYLSFLKPLYCKIRKVDSPWWKDKLPWVPFEHYYHWTPKPLLEALSKVGFNEVQNHYFHGYDRWTPTEGGQPFFRSLYRSVIDLLFRVSGKRIAGMLIATGRKPL